ncbi:RNA-binding transcriptional accessory protein [Myxococcota bacterium]|nr:RNA-binding transcriptional accessory protein [Myxococcota bacterium]
MALDHPSIIAAELGVRPAQVAATVALLDGGATVPFISRYRKEATGSLDDLQVAEVRDRIASLRALDERRAEVLASIEEQGRLTDELRAEVLAARTRSALEDLYLPYRPKRRTRAIVARERGLLPLAERILAQEDSLPASRHDLAAPFAAACDALDGPEAAWAGARDIVAERISEDAALRAELRAFALDTALFQSRVVPGQEEAGARFRDWFDHREPAKRVPSHRVLAMRRGEAEGVLSLRLMVDDDGALARIRARTVRNPRAALADDLSAAIQDSWGRLLGPSIETDVRLALKEAADAEAIRVFASNLRNLLVAPPLGGRRVVAIDPGFRSGCKVAALSESGDLLENVTVHPHSGPGQAEQARASLAALLLRHRPDAIAVGNGTAGRETEAFVREVLAAHPDLAGVAVVSVNESGASVYSASEIAREELPDHDVTVRGSVSIGRRLQDPLAELVKIDPKSIGVGQYQHDVDQPRLHAALDDVVSSCVNGVGVDLNTASPRLLEYVAGIGPALAKSIVAWRAERGGFASRRQLLDVPRLGPRAFEQCAGFLRIRGGGHPLDASAVHPERYPVVERMAGDLGVPLPDLVGNEDLVGRIPWERYVSGDLGAPTLQDILDELRRPGRDPRRAFEAVRFRDDVTEIAHLSEGMELAGIVTNVTNFGAFVDVGIHQDGLVHVSELSHQFVRDPAQAVAVGDRVRVKVLAVDAPRKRISLSIKALLPAPAGRTGAGGARPHDRGGAPRDGARPPPREGGPRQGPPPGRPAPASGRGPGGGDRRPEPFNNPLAAALKGLKVDRKK